MGKLNKKCVYLTSLKSNSYHRNISKSALFFNEFYSFLIF